MVDDETPPVDSKRAIERMLRSSMGHERHEVSIEVRRRIINPNTRANDPIPLMFAAATVLVGLALGSILLPSAPGQGAWTVVTNGVSPARYGAAYAVTSDGALLMVGGSGPEGPTTQFDRLDPAANTWSSLPDAPTPRTDAAAAILGTSLYVVGGWTQGGEWLSTVDRFDLTLEVWTSGPQLPGPRIATAAIADKQSVYILGGATKDGPTAAILRLVTGGAEWEPYARLPEPRAFAAAAVSTTGTIIVSGGKFSDLNPYSRDLQLFDTTTRKWLAGPPLTVGRNSHVMLVMRDGDLLVIGGYGGPSGASLASVELLAQGTDRWQASSDLPSPLSQMAAGVLAERVVVVGGCCGEGGEPSRLQFELP